MINTDPKTVYRTEIQCCYLQQLFIQYVRLNLNRVGLHVLVINSNTELRPTGRLYTCVLSEYIIWNYKVEELKDVCKVCYNL